MMVYICTKYHENILNRIIGYRADTVFIAKISAGHNSQKILGGVTFFFSTHRLMMVYISIKFNENTIEDIKITERTRLSSETFHRGIIPSQI